MKTIDFVGISRKQNDAQEAVCVCSFWGCCVLATALMATAIILPVVKEATEITHWIGLVLEAFSIALAYIAYWIKRYAIQDIK